MTLGPAKMKYPNQIRAKMLEHLPKMPKDVDKFEEFLYVIGEHPNQNWAFYTEHMSCDHNRFYRYLAEARRVGLVRTDEYVLTFPVFDRNFNTIIPGALKTGLLADICKDAVHFAAHLARYKDDEYPMGYSITRLEITNKINYFFEINPDENVKLLLTLQECLAQISLSRNQLDNWKDMQGIYKEGITINQAFNGLAIYHRKEDFEEGA